MSTVSDEVEAMVRRMERLAGGSHKRVIDAATGKTHRVPVRDIVLKGIKQQDLHTYPEWVVAPEGEELWEPRVPDDILEGYLIPHLRECVRCRRLDLAARIVQEGGHGKHQGEAVFEHLRQCPDCRVDAMRLALRCERTIIKS